MSAQIKKSLIGDPTIFAKEVATYVGDLNAWSAHMEKVATTKHLPDRHPEKFTPYPSPTASALVTSAVSGGDGKFKADYSIVDDGPTPGQILDRKKDALLHILAAEEARAKLAILPNGKRRLRSLVLTDIYAKIGNKERLTDDERGILDEQKIIDSKTRAVERHAAELHVKIDDLTVGTVDKFVLTPFPV